MLKKTTTIFIASGLLASSWAVAQENDGPDPATMVELYACNFSDDMGYGELEDVIDDWNDWADDEDITNYSAWTLTPFYSGPEQDFDVIWLGGSDSGAGLGRVQDLWLRTGGEVADQFAEVMDCGVHAGYATLNFKDPAERDDPDNLVLSFTDCKISEDSSFTELVPAMMAWGQYYAENDSNAGFWSLSPSMGGGKEDFNFKWVVAHQNLETRGKDFDFWAEGGWKKGQELFGDKVSCDSSRVYIAKNVRRAEETDD